MTEKQLRKLAIKTTIGAAAIYGAFWLDCYLTGLFGN